MLIRLRSRHEPSPRSAYTCIGATHAMNGMVYDVEPMRTCSISQILTTENAARSGEPTKLPKGLFLDKNDVENITSQQLPASGTLTPILLQTQL